MTLSAFGSMGGPLFFSNNLSAEVTSGCDIFSGLLCDCDVQIDIANDILIRQIIIYHLNINHVVCYTPWGDRTVRT